MDDVVTANLALLLSYDGGPFQGWQIQPHSETVQGVIERTLAIPLRRPVPIIGASRTDTGVHALGQVAHCQVPKHCSLPALWKSLNGLLPPAIRCRALAWVPSSFHSQLWAKGKLYVYRVQKGAVRDPLRRCVTAHFPYACDTDLLRQGARLLLGTHDFAAFSNANTQGQAARDSRRTLWRFDVAYIS